MDNFNALKEYYTEFKTSLVTKGIIYKNLKLGQWCLNLRSEYNRDESSKGQKLSKERIDLLEQTFPDWSWDYYEAKWMQHFNALKEYYKKFKTSRVHNRATFKELKLGNWVSYQRKSYNNDGSYGKPKLSKEKSKLLEQTFHDWSWDRLEDQWMEYFNTLKEYYKEFKTSLVPARENYKELELGKWVSHQRAYYNNKSNPKKPKLPKQKSDLFEQSFSDWKWKLKEDVWMQNFNVLKEYYNEFKTSRVNTKLNYKNLNIGRWVSTQRKAFKRDEGSTSRISIDRIDLLEKTFHDWSWDLMEDIWLENFNLLKEYYKEFKNTQISNNETYKNKKLGIWVRNQRIDYIRKEPRLSNKKIKLLEQTFHDWSWGRK